MISIYRHVLGSAIIMFKIGTCHNLCKTVSKQNTIYTFKFARLILSRVCINRWPLWEGQLNCINIFIKHLVRPQTLWHLSVRVRLCMSLCISLSPSISPSSCRPRNFTPTTNGRSTRPTTRQQTNSISSMTTPFKRISVLYTHHTI